MTINETKFDWAYALSPRSTTTHLIIHHAAGQGSAQSIHNYHRGKGWAGIAYHYYIRRDGSIFRGRPENMRGGHTTDWNYCSIGICFEGNFELEQMGEAQKNAGRDLVADIVERHSDIVLGKHSKYGATSCPGKNFPFVEISTPKSQPEKPVEWAKDACDWAIEQGLFKGDGDGDYRWQETVTRQELAVLFERFYKMK